MQCNVSSIFSKVVKAKFQTDLYFLKNVMIHVGLEISDWWQKLGASMMAASNENISRVTGPLYWDFTGHPPPHKGQWRIALMFSLICAWLNGWLSNRNAGDLRRHRAYYDVTVMSTHEANFITGDIWWNAFFNPVSFLYVLPKTIYLLPSISYKTI